jgi:hypothetical protein
MTHKKKVELETLQGHSSLLAYNLAAVGKADACGVCVLREWPHSVPPSIILCVAWHEDCWRLIDQCKTEGSCNTAYRLTLL